MNIFFLFASGHFFSFVQMKRMGRKEEKWRKRRDRFRLFPTQKNPRNCDGNDEGDPSEGCGRSQTRLAPPPPRPSTGKGGGS